MLDDRPEDAEPYIRQHLTFSILEYVETPTFIAEAKIRFGECLARQGRFHEAEKTLREGLDQLNACRGSIGTQDDRDDRNDEMRASYWLAGCLCEQGQYNEVQQLLEPTLAEDDAILDTIPVGRSQGEKWLEVALHGGVVSSGLSTASGVTTSTSMTLGIRDLRLSVTGGRSASSRLDSTASALDAGID